MTNQFIGKSSTYIFGLSEKRGLQISWFVTKSSLWTAVTEGESPVNLVICPFISQSYPYPYPIITYAICVNARYDSACMYACMYKYVYICISYCMLLISKIYQIYKRVVFHGEGVQFPCPAFAGTRWLLTRVNWRRCPRRLTPRRCSGVSTRPGLLR